MRYLLFATSMLLVALVVILGTASVLRDVVAAWNKGVRSDRSEIVQIATGR
jgi:hypothetical protein